MDMGAAQSSFECWYVLSGLGQVATTLANGIGARASVSFVKSIKKVATS